MKPFKTTLSLSRVLYTFIGMLLCAFHAVTSQAQSIAFSGSTSLNWTAKVNNLRVIISGDAGGAVVGSVKVTFTPTSGTATSINFSGNSQDQTQQVHVKNLSLTTTFSGTPKFLFATPSTANSLADGTYSVRASYQRAANNATITSSPITITIDTSSFVPGFTNPASSGVYGQVLPIAYDINENYSAGTAKLTFSTVSGTTNTITLSDSNLSSTSFNLNTAALAASSPTFITSATPNSIADGTYTVTLSYTETTSSSVTTSAKTFVTIDATAPDLSVVVPISGFKTDGKPGFTAFTTEGGALSYSGGCNGTTTSVSAGIFTVSLASDGSGTSLSDGTYANCAVRVTDNAGNPSAQVSVGSFTVDRVAPAVSEVTPVDSITTNQSPSVTFSAGEQGTITYLGGCTSATTTAQSGNNTITLLGSTIGYVLPLGTYTNCGIQVTDAAGNVSQALVFSPFSIVAQTPTPGTTATPNVTATPTATHPPQVANRTGRIVDENGNGIPDTLVYIYQVGNFNTQADSQAAAADGGGVGALAVITDANGYYSFKGIPDGIYMARPQTSGLVFEPSEISFEADSVPPLIMGMGAKVSKEGCSTDDFVSELLSAVDKSRALSAFLKETVSTSIEKAEEKLKGSRMNKLIASLNEAAAKGNLAFTDLLQQSELLPTATLACGSNTSGCSSKKFRAENRKLRGNLLYLRRLNFLVARNSRLAFKGKGASPRRATSRKISRLYTDALKASRDLPVETDECI